MNVDVVDPAFALERHPGTGGVSRSELRHLLRGLEGAALVGGEVVEVAPACDHAEITALAATTVGYDIVKLMAKRPLSF